MAQLKGSATNELEWQDRMKRQILILVPSKLPLFWTHVKIPQYIVHRRRWQWAWLIRASSRTTISGSWFHSVSDKLTRFLGDATARVHFKPPYLTNWASLL